MKITKERFKELIAQEVLKGNKFEIKEESENYCIVCGDDKYAFEVNFKEMEKNDDSNWNQIIDVFMDKREPRGLSHYTRIVGYYSQTHNWNNSKMGELADRHAGDYSILKSEKASHPI